MGTLLLDRARAEDREGLEPGPYFPTAPAIRKRYRSIEGENTNPVQSALSDFLESKSG